ncbi:MAG TPA: penicillin-binding protein 1C [Gallionellaceae bacterium]|nr:penicillin-binding protein 1C [Gallionellaceae bacterium]
MKPEFFRSGLAAARDTRWVRGARNAAPYAALLFIALLALRLWPHDSLRGYYPGSVAVYASDGTLLRMALATDDQFRVWVPLEQMDPRLPEAVQEYEDRWFYWHPGFNPFALARAAFSTYGGGKREGASTLTMQLARRLYGIRSQTVGGKLRQIAYAAWLELRYSKHDILEAYLNYAPYGGNVEGAGAASLIYFHKRPAQLTLPEVLTLAVIPQNPNKRGMRSDGPSPLMDARARLFGIWQARHPRSAAYKSDLTTPPHLYGVSDLPFRAPHLTDMLLREHSTDALAAKSGEILSTVDLRLQDTLERLVSQFIKNHSSVGIRNASVMLIDRTTGEVRALVGSADYFNNSIDGQVNGTLAKRSPGSTLKPFIYGLALDQGLLHPQTILKDAPSSFGPFSPENFDGQFVGPISAQQALVRSRNIPAVYVASRLRQPTLYEFLKAQHVSRLASEQHYGLALALGGAELTMEELGRLYLMLGNRGVPMPLRYEHSAGQAEGGAGAPHVLSEAAAFITVQMLDTNIRPDTGRPAAPPVAWKTGTSWGFRDAWTAGIFGHYVLLVWVGNFDSTGNPAFIGIKAAAPLFFKIVDSMRAQHLDPGELARPWPADVKRIQVCAASGDLPNKWCKDTVPTWFIPGKSPIKVSDLDRAVRIDTRTGRATCKDGPYVKTEVFEFWPTDLRRLFRQAGMPRRTPPPLPDCGNGGSAIVSGDAFANPEDTRDNPQITSPIQGVTYTVRLSKPSPILLRANVSGRDRKLFWFANDSLIGQGSAGQDIAWKPAVPGKYELRAIDSEGRADAREVIVEFVE